MIEWGETGACEVGKRENNWHLSQLVGVSGTER